VGLFYGAAAIAESKKMVSGYFFRLHEQPMSAGWEKEA
jgi:hypothetical protein